MDPYLAPTYYIESEHPAVVQFKDDHTNSGQGDIEKAVSLYYAVRDKIRYNPYTFGNSKEKMRASYILSQGEGYCVTKAVLLCSCARAAGIPARLGFADVKNHLNTQKLRQTMGTDVFVYHGYTELLLEDRWVKATPAFNIELCENFNVKPLEFNGREDSVLHAFDQNGKKHMEYLKERGTFADLPLEEIWMESLKWYPKMAEYADLQKDLGDFHKQALAENR